MIGSVITSKRSVLKGNPVSSFILQSQDLTKWILIADANGVLQSFSGAAGTPTDVKMTGGSDVSVEASISISNSGAIQVKTGIDLSGTASLDDNFRIRGQGGIIYKITITSADEIQLIEV